jgi:hypothetical protein
MPGVMQPGRRSQAPIAQKHKNLGGVKQMTKYKKYYAGENHYQWEVKIVIYQKHNLYKFVLTDDEDTIYIASNYVTPATANALEETINEIMHKSAQYESLTDIYNTLQNTFYGQVFYLGKKIAPQLTDGILLLSLSE